MDIKGSINTKRLKVKEADIKAAEEQLGVVFPEPYKEFLKRVTNPEIGGWVLHPIKDQAITHKMKFNIVKQNRECRNNNMPKDFISIEEDRCSGDQLCFKVKNGVVEKGVYLWNHETGEVEELAPHLMDFIGLF